MTLFMIIEIRLNVGGMICLLFKLQMKGAFNSRTRGKNVGLSRGGKTSSGRDCSVVQSGLTHMTYNGIFSDCGTSCNFWYTHLFYWRGFLLLHCLTLSNMCNLMSEHYKANGKGEGGSVCVSASVMGPTTHDLMKSINRWVFSCNLVAYVNSNC